MAVFAYRGLTADGRAVRGVIDADSAREMREGTAVGVTLDVQHAHLFELGECGARLNGT